MKLKSSLLLVLLVLLVAVIPLSVAQDGMFGLSAEDMALLSSQNFDADSVSLNLSLSLQVSGAPEGDSDSQISGSGIIGMDANGMLTGEAVITGTMSAEGESESIDLQARAVDGVMYINENNEGWMGMTLDDAMGMMSAFAPIPDPSALASGSMGDNTAMIPAFGDMMTALEAFNANEFIQMSRLDDMNGLAHFQIVLDVQGFLQSDGFNSLLESAGEMDGEGSMAGMGAMLAFMVQDTNITIDEFISPDDSRVRQLIVNVAFTVDPSMMGETEAEPVSVSFNLDVSNINYDVPVNVVAPEDAVMMPSASG